ncbi:carbohydrate-binding protein [Thermotoga sp. KOL6]|uniref:carbohydrate-binding protein n=1 Tax=Thermotoga sp. KOL6 TaxID=126741 RepID=UPI000C78741A|nr:carbohydrate-binding protein [Thermotoga sp. KOL6]PLV58673.1 hypothetical protein AS005_07240 [Thermotoga sp. KOL6]
MKSLFISLSISLFLLAACTLTTMFTTPPIEQNITETQWISATIESSESTFTVVTQSELPGADEHGTVVYVSPSSTDTTGFISVWFDLKKLLGEEVGINDSLHFSIDVLQTRVNQATVTMNIIEEDTETVISTKLLTKNEWETFEATYTLSEDPDNLSKFLLGIVASDPATLDFYIDDLKISIQFSSGGVS